MRDKQEVEVVDFLIQVKDCVVRDSLGCRSLASGTLASLPGSSGGGGGGGEREREYSPPPPPQEPGHEATGTLAWETGRGEEGPGTASLLHAVDCSVSAFNNDCATLTCVRLSICCCF